MLTRLRFKKDFRLIVRCLSDKPSDDGKVPEIQAKDKIEDKKSTENATDKIQELLKSMLAAPKISEEEYRKNFATAPERPKKRKQKDEIEVKVEKIEDSITKAAGDVAQAIGGDVKQTEAELLSKVLGKINQSPTSLSDLLVGMKVDRSTEKDETKPAESRGQQVKRIIDRKTSGQTTPTRFTQRKMTRPDGAMQERRPKRSVAQAITVDVNSGAPLNIFKPSESHYGTTLALWEALNKRELTLATAQPPANYFEKMILWTEQGKIWKFPIDNEQGLEEENKVHFSEHVFVDQHLEGWCPKKGPIRHFMELVCVGLSKNPFYTVKEKKETIMWYKDYFESKKDLLNEVGAWEQKQTNTEAST